MFQPRALFRRSLEDFIIATNADPRYLLDLFPRLPSDLSEELISWLQLDDLQLYRRAVKEGYNRVFEIFYKPVYPSIFKRKLITWCVESGNVAVLEQVLDWDYDMLEDICRELATRDQGIMAILFDNRGSPYCSDILASPYANRYFSQDFIEVYGKAFPYVTYNLRYRYSEVYMAAVWGDKELIDYLLQEGDVEEAKIYILAGAARGGHLALYNEYLRQNGTVYENTIVFHAITGGHRQMIDKIWSLLRERATENRNARDILVRANCNDILEALIEYGDADLLEEFTTASNCGFMKLEYSTTISIIVTNGIGYLPKQYLLKKAEINKGRDRPYLLEQCIMKGDRVLLELILNSWTFDNKLRNEALAASRRRGDPALTTYLQQRLS